MRAARAAAEMARHDRDARIKEFVDFKARAEATAAQAAEDRRAAILAGDFEAALFAQQRYAAALALVDAITAEARRVIPPAPGFHF